MKLERDLITMTAQRFINRYFVAAIAALLLFAVMVSPLPAAAQGVFSPVAKVNDRVVTQYELEQRTRFMQLLRAPGGREEALTALINERLQEDAAAKMGIQATEETIQQGMEEFASRANLTAEQFVKLLAQGGVDKETFRDFVRAGLVWREVVRTRFTSRIQVSESEIDRAMALASTAKGGLRVLLNEIILPAPPGQTAQAQRRAEQIRRITSLAAFSSAARKYSASASRRVGGRLPWMPLSNLPPQIRGQILALSPGQVSAPISIPNGIVLFQLRAIEETGSPEPQNVSVEFAKYLIAGGKSEAARKEAARIKGRVDTCDDLYGINKGQPEERLQLETKKMSELPKEVAIELAKLDPGEISTQLTSADGKTLELLMLCARIPEAIEDVSRDDIRQRLANQALESYANGYLAQLRADATIEVIGQ